VSSLDNLRKDAKRWLEALREGNAAARTRFERAWPGGPRQPVLRDVQQALARERGFESWTKMAAAIERPAPDEDDLFGLMRAAEAGTMPPQAWRAAFDAILRPQPNAVRAGYRYGDLIVAAAATAPAYVIEALMKHGAAANVEAGPSVAPEAARGFQPLHSAGYHGNAAAAEVLLRFGGDPSARDRTFNRTPADWADAGGHLGLRDRLREAARQELERRRETQASRDPVALFLHSACWDHHVHGAGDHRMYDRAAQRLLAASPGIATASVYTAVVCGELDEVRRLLRERPAAAREAGGPRQWTPLLYLCYTRFTHPPTLANTEAIARLLLDRGADPDDFYMAGDSQYTALVGVAGEGEQDSPRQPWAPAVYRLLLERGAGPYDIQVLYDTHFSTDMLWWLQLTYDVTVARGRRADWDDPAWKMLDMGGYGPGSYFVIDRATRRNNVALVEWALAHGADPDIMSSDHRRFRPARSLFDSAVLLGRDEIAALLARHGARSAGPAAQASPEELFSAAALRLDRPAAERLLAAHPELRTSTRALFHAASQDRVDALALLESLGFALDMADASNTRALHNAAGHGALDAIRCLIDRGVEIDPRETSWNGVPISWAAHSDRTAAVDLLSRYSRDLWTLCFRGYVDRVGAILRDDPSLARQVRENGVTPLWWLPDDDGQAMAIVELLLAAGADPAATSTAGTTAADWARRRGMADVARRLESGR
jgi:ankyrin repeat protein